MSEHREQVVTINMDGRPATLERLIPPDAAAFGRRLERAKEYVQKADDWVTKHKDGDGIWKLFPNLSQVSMAIGVDFGWQFSITLTWNKPNKGAS